MKAFGEMAEQANAAIKQKHLEFINSYTTGPTGNIDDSAVTEDGYALSDTVYTREWNKNGRTDGRTPQEAEADHCSTEFDTPEETR